MTPTPTSIIDVQAPPRADRLTEKLIQIQVSQDPISTVAEAMAAKRDLEACINKLVRNFETRTKCPLISIDRKDGTVGRTFWVPRVILG